MSMWDAVREGFGLATAWPAGGFLIGFLILGTALGLYFGAIPGLGGMAAFSLLIPTFKMSAASGPAPGFPSFVRSSVQPVACAAGRAVKEE